MMSHFLYLGDSLIIDEPKQQVKRHFQTKELYKKIKAKEKIY